MLFTKMHVPEDAIVVVIHTRFNVQSINRGYRGYIVFYKQYDFANDWNANGLTL